MPWGFIIPLSILVLIVICVAVCICYIRRKNAIDLELIDVSVSNTIKDIDGITSRTK